MVNETLLIYLRKTALATPSWAVINANGKILQSAINNNHYDLKSLAQNREVIAIVPGQDVLLTQVTLPLLSRDRALQAIPYALEDQLIADLDSLHYAVPTPLPVENVSVAVVSNEVMETWLALFSSLNITPNAFIPAPLALPYQHDEWSLFIDDIANVRTGLYSGWVAEKTAYTEWLNTKEVLHVNVYATQGNEKDLTVPAIVLSGTESLQLMANAIRETPHINLLQGKYSRQNNRSKQGYLWKLIAYAAITLALLLFFYPLFSYFVLHSRLEKMNDEIAVIYTKHFPNATAVVSPKERIAAKLRTQTSQGFDDNALSLLANIAVAKKQVAQINVMRLDYAREQLTIELTAPTAEIFAKFTDALKQQNVTIKQQNASLSNQVIHATLMI